MEQGARKGLDKERLRYNLRTVLQTDEKKQLNVLYECTHCLFRLPSFALVCAHLLEEHNERPLIQVEKTLKHSCNTCVRKFSTKTKLEEHMRDHTGARPFLCLTCGKSFKTKKLVKCHIKMHRLEAHRKIHFPESHTEKCDICGFSTYRKWKLKSHMRTHTREETYSCDECGKSFVHSSGLLAHKKKHTPFPHKCKVCGKAFGQAFDLQMHMATHAVKKEFECDICHNFFAQKCTLIQHQWLKHKKFHMIKAYKQVKEGRENQTLVCDFCQKVYTIPCCLRKHIEKHLQVEVEKKNLIKIVCTLP
ncbi:Hypothetical predicted protein [Cloeon dipterum]|uniref:C2H2-type domain-containing protein n=1 Tax=Cloeon dipterum TaxID=197152 RepID=A0A8S1DZW9_9INSE|nr:Hypothetical predicted protein [Cloeon dipterum]